MASTGEAWNQFTLLEPLGKGGMGEVFLADDESLNRKVALKILPESLRGDSTARERLLREARAAAALDHPYICKIYEIGDVQGKAFIAMEYVKGLTLQEKLDRGPLSPSELLQLGEEIGEAVEAAHRKGIVHRDLKTPNIMVTEDGHVKVMDFGLATQLTMEHGRESKVETLSGKLTEHGVTPGTVLYMSPEQVRGEPLDTRSDIFSLGVVLYEMATGKVPFQGATSGLTYDAILNRGATPPRHHNPEVLPGLEQVIQKTLEKDKENRYQSVREVIVDLKRLRRDSDSATAAFAGPSFAAGTGPSRDTGSRAILLAGLVALVVLVAAFLLFRSRSPGPDPAPAGGEAITSLAVLPFENTRDDPEVDYLSDGIAESLINRLSQLPQLSVMARSTAFRYRGAVDPQQVGEELEVGAVLTGRVVQQGDRLNVQAELVDTRRGTQIWGEQYQHELADLLTVQNVLATEITGALKLQLTGDERELLRSGTSDSEAYRAYLRGRFLWNKRTNEDFKRAITFFEEAREKDPGYAPALAGLADCYFLLGSQFYGLDDDFPPREAIDRARSAALSAIELDERLAEPRATLGFIRLTYDWDWEGAETSFREAIARDESYGTAHQWYSVYLSALGRHQEAIGEAQQAIALEPSSPLSNRILGIAYYQARQYERAIEQLERTRQLDPSFPLVREWLIDAYWLRGDREKATELATALDPEIGELYRLVAKSGEESREKAAELARTYARNPLSVARFYSLAGDDDALVSALSSAQDERHPALITTLINPLLDPFLEDPRIIDLRARIGLPQ